MRDTLLEVFVRRARTEPGREALRDLAAGGAAEERVLTWSQWDATSRALAATFAADGVAPGARVAVLAGNSTRWAEAQGIDARDDALNESLSPPERIRRFHILDCDLSVEAGELTPTMKVRRAVVVERFAEQVEALYQ